MLPGVRRAPAEISDLPCGTVAVGRDASPVPEPFTALALYWKVMFVMAWPTRRSAPSTLGVSEAPAALEVDTASTSSCSMDHQGSVVPRYPVWTIITMRNASDIARVRCRASFRDHGYPSTPQVPTSYALS